VRCRILPRQKMFFFFLFATTSFSSVFLHVFNILSRFGSLELIWFEKLVMLGSTERICQFAEESRWENGRELVTFIECFRYLHVYNLGLRAWEKFLVFAGGSTAWTARFDAAIGRILSFLLVYFFNAWATDTNMNKNIKSNEFWAKAWSKWIERDFLL
jgi:hypothetical protein